MNNWDEALFPGTTGLGPGGADEFIRSAMQWHFGADTGSPFWLREAKPSISTGLDIREPESQFTVSLAVRLDLLAEAGAAVDREASM